MVDRWDVGACVVGLLVVLAIIPLGADPAEALTIVVAALGLVAATIAANHSIGRSPRLVVEYRNVNAGGEPVVWASEPSRLRPTLHVYVRNEGRGPAEAVEVRFDRVQASHLWNESGNANGDVEENLHPPRFTRPNQVLNPHDEWCIAMLSWHGVAVPDATAVWRASAKGMKATEGVVRVRRLEAPPTTP